MTPMAHPSSPPPPSDGRPVLGWAHRSWGIPAMCVVEDCGRVIRAGVVHHKDHGDPPKAAMCLSCHGTLMHEPDKFREEHPSEALPAAPGTKWWRRNDRGNQ